MGSVYPRGNRLWIRFKDPDGKWTQARTSYVLGEKKLAREALGLVEDRIAAGIRFGGREHPVVTVRRFADQWIKDRKALGIREWSNDDARLKLHVLSSIGAMPIDQVRPRHLIELAHALRREGKLAPRTIYHVFGTLHVLFRDAVISELVTATPCVLTRTQLGKKEDKNPEWRATAIFTRDELETLISSDQVPEDRRVLYALAGLAGLRSGEAIGLFWRNYDAAAAPLGRIVVAHSHAREGTKTGRSREVPAHPVLAAMLAEWKLKGWVEIMGRPPKPDDLVIPSRLQHMRSRHHTRNKLLDDLKRLGLRARRVHDLRRTFITLARVDGARKDILEMISHASRGDIIDIYTSMPWPSLCEEIAKLRVQRHQGIIADLLITGESH